MTLDSEVRDIVTLCNLQGQKIAIRILGVCGIQEQYAAPFLPVSSGQSLQETREEFRSLTYLFFLPALRQKLVGDFFDLWEGHLPEIWRKHLRDFFGPTNLDGGNSAFVIGF